MTVDEVVTYFGSVAAAARALGINPAAIYQWDRVPRLRQLELERMTHGALRAADDNEEPTPLTAA